MKMHSLDFNKIEIHIFNTSKSLCSITHHSCLISKVPELLHTCIRMANEWWRYQSSLIVLLVLHFHDTSGQCYPKDALKCYVCHLDKSAHQSGIHMPWSPQQLRCQGGGIYISHWLCGSTLDQYMGHWVKSMHVLKILIQLQGWVCD